MFMSPFMFVLTFYDNIKFTFPLGRIERIKKYFPNNETSILFILKDDSILNLK
jgi:hypothetical protein